MRSLSTMFDPKSVAVIGASATLGKWGNYLSRTVLQGAERRSVFLVNRRGGDILGHPSFKSIEDLPEAPELVVLVVPAHNFEQSIDSSLKAGAKSIIAISAGLGELGDDAKMREMAVVRKVRDAGSVMLGPNCMGVIDTTTSLSATAHLTLPGGDIAVVSQSGGIGMELGCLAAHAGVGFSRFISLGNQADLNAADFVRDLAAHEHTRVIALYLEDTGQGRGFVEAAQTVRENGKRLVLLCPGRTEVVERATQSHTGSLATDDHAIDALCGAAGIIRVHTPRELFDTAVALRKPRIPQGWRIAIVSDGGGPAVVASSLAGNQGLSVPAFSKKLTKTIGENANEFASVGNPVDLLADDPESVAQAVKHISRSGEVDAILVTGSFGYIAAKQYPTELGDLSDLEQAEIDSATKIGRIVEAGDFPVIASTIATPSPVVDELANFHIPMYGDVESAVAILTKLCRLGEAPTNGLEMPTPSTSPVVSTSYESSRDFLSREGVDFVEARYVTGLEDAITAAHELGYPLVLKALGLLHKSDSGGVAIGIYDADALATAFEDMRDRLHPERFSVERMAPLSDGVELIVGTRWDEKIGPLLLLGLGGIFAEVLGDVKTALAPVTPETVRHMLDSLGGADILRGARGRSPVNFEAVVELATIVARVAAEHPEILEMEANPVLALPDRALALDARIVLKNSENPQGSTLGPP
jgi:acyl-CoA synthetase (NDP forming)